MHLVLSSRSDPGLPMAGLRASGKMTEIRTGDLCLTEEEGAAYLQEAVATPLSEEVLVSVLRQTEGWITGLHLAALSLQGSGDPASLLARLQTGYEHVMGFLREEVLARQPRPVQDFLLKTSILDRLSGPLCEAVTAQNTPERSGQAWLEWLERANLFTLSLDNRKQWFRYHRQFRELLKQQLASSHQAPAIAALHSRASAWYAENGLVTEALGHAVAAGDESTAIRLIVTHRHDSMDQEQWPQLLGWLRLLPQRLVDSSPELLLLETWTMHHSCQSADIPARLDRVEAMLQDSTSNAGTQGLRGEMDALRSQQACWSADPEAALRAARHSLATTPIQLSGVRGVAWVSLAGALAMSGDPKTAFDALYQGLNENTLRNKSFTTHLLSAFSCIHWMAADPHSLLQTASYVLREASEHDLPESLAWAHYHQGCAYYLQNDLVSAEGCFAAVAGHWQIAPAFTSTQGAFGLASTYLAQGFVDRAKAVAQSVLTYASEANNPGLLAAPRLSGLSCALAGTESRGRTLGGVV